MREWADKGELLEKVAQALRDAENTAPRQSNAHLEGAKLIAALYAIDQFWADRGQSAYETGSGAAQAAGPVEEQAASGGGVPASTAAPPASPPSDDPPEPRHHPRGRQR
jgi:hypothetical protein